jgi:hypothetical protein
VTAPGLVRSLIDPPIVSGATPTLEARVFWRFSRTSRWELTSSSLFANHGKELKPPRTGSPIVPPIVSGATPTLEAHVAA